MLSESCDNDMLRACSICGKIHDISQPCPDRNPLRNAKADRFRNTVAWKRKREEVKKRDCYLCRYCFDIKYKVNTSNLSVHHINSIEKAYHQRLDNDNLITLCADCHSKAETGKIDKKTLKRLAKYPPTLNKSKI